MISGAFLQEQSVSGKTWLILRNKFVLNNFFFRPAPNVCFLNSIDSIWEPAEAWIFKAFFDEIA